MIIAFNKPYGVLSQFTPEEGCAHKTLAEFNFPPDVYAVGRLDGDSEGLLLLSDDEEMPSKLLSPKLRHPRLYWAQVEGIPTQSALEHLQNGVTIREYTTLPCKAWILDPQPEIPERNPPVRKRVRIPTCWIAMELTEGKNRQVRRMTAAVGFPTLRLIRKRIGALELGDLPVGEYKILSKNERRLVFAK